MVGEHEQNIELKVEFIKALALILRRDGKKIFLIASIHFIFLKEIKL